MWSPLPPNMALHSIVSITYEPPPHNLACQSRNNFHYCSPPPPKHGPSLCCVHYIQTHPPIHTHTTWPLNPHIHNAVINTYTKRFLLIRDLRILKLSDSLETHFFSINALFRSLTKASTFGFSSNELVEE